jgi:gas vesicle protein
LSRTERLAAKAEKQAAKGKRRGGFLFGAIAGAAIGLLLAPKSGKETRAQLFGEGGIGDQVDRLKGAVGAGKDSAADQSEALKRKIEETRERLRRQMDVDDDAPAGGAPVE